MRRPLSVETSNTGADVSPYPDSPWDDRRSKRRLLAVVALLLLVPPIAAGLLSGTQAKTYAAEADVLYQGSDTTDAQSIERELATQQVLLQSRPLIEVAAEAAGRPAEQVDEAVTVDILEQSSVLRLHVEDRDPEVAEEIATSLVDQYIAAVQVRSDSSATVEEERQLLQGQADDLIARLREVTARIGDLVDIAVPSAAVQLELRTLEAEGQTIRGRLTALQTQILDADLRGLQEQGGGARVFAPAAVLDEPVGPQPLRAVAAGALFGLVLAVGLVALLRYRHERSRPPTT